MTARPPMVLLDSMTRGGVQADPVADALLYESPHRIFVARTPDMVENALAEADAARIATGKSLANMQRPVPNHSMVSRTNGRKLATVQS